MQINVGKYIILHKKYKILDIRDVKLKTKTLNL